jgi:hypothetical protein
MVTVQGQSRRVLVTGVSIALAVVLLAALYVLLRPSSAEDSAGVSESHLFKIDISADPDTLTARAQRGVPVFKARQGDTVTLVATSTQPGSLHVHVYDRSVLLIPGSKVTLTFAATSAGAFPIHWHDPQNLMIHLAILEVRPR